MAWGRRVATITLEVCQWLKIENARTQVVVASRIREATIAVRNARSRTDRWVPSVAVTMTFVAKDSPWVQVDWPTEATILRRAERSRESLFWMTGARAISIKNCLAAFLSAAPGPTRRRSLIATCAVVDTYPRFSFFQLGYEVEAFWSLTCSSFTTCFTFGTPAASLATRSRAPCEFTFPVRVTTFTWWCTSRSM